MSIVIGLLVASGVGYFYYVYLNDFEKSAGVKTDEIIERVKQGWQANVFENNSHLTVLILGVDTVENRSGDPLLTDTLLLGTVNTDNGRVKLISLPRDLWSVAYQTKINALYTYGKDRDELAPEKFPTEVIAQMTGVSIDRTIVISLNQLKEIIDILEGVKVDNPMGFRDEQFPRTDVDIRTETDPAKLYMTVEFPEGRQLLNGEQALQFIRSRHSEDKESGTDDARAVRQQLVIQALVERLSDWQFYRNADQVGKLYAWYQRSFNDQFSLEHTASLLRKIDKKNLQVSLEGKSLGVVTEATEEGAIWHPPVSKYGQWVYEVKDEELFRKEIQDYLYQ